jgi:hypothetical protein
MRTAFKEWAVVVDALGRGEQIIILRKGGIHEGKGGFKPEHSAFFLFPTLFHQQREAVIERAQLRYDQLLPGFPPKNILRLQTFCQVVEVHRIDDRDRLAALQGHHLWRQELLEERFEWSKHKHIYCLVVRAWNLPEAVELPMLPEYGGCKSWITLNQEIPITNALPVLDNQAFASRLKQVRDVLIQDRAA